MGAAPDPEEDGWVLAATVGETFTIQVTVDMQTSVPVQSLSFELDDGLVTETMATFGPFPPGDLDVLVQWIPSLDSDLDFSKRLRLRAQTTALPDGQDPCHLNLGNGSSLGYIQVGG